MRGQKVTAKHKLIVWGLFALVLLATKLGLWLFFTGYLARHDVLAEDSAVPVVVIEADGFAELAEAARESVVFIQSYVGVECDELVASGVGFAIDDEGLIATNHHVVAEGERILVHFPCGLVIPASVWREDEALDVALLATGVATRGLALGRRLQLEAGDAVVYVSRDDNDTLAVTGKVITPNGYRNGQWMIHLDIPVVPGQSGSPVLSADGKVVGMVSYYIVDTGVRSRSMAVGIDDVIKVWVGDTK
ncbi:MAG TPA: serine protease [Bacillota bacterium]|nr:serine protease [Bacillota bacterium]